MVDSLLHTLLFAPLLIAIAFGALALCLGLALLFAPRRLHSWQALTLRDNGGCASPWLSIRVQTWRRWAAYYGDSSLDCAVLPLGRAAQASLPIRLAQARANAAASDCRADQGEI